MLCSVLRPGPDSSRRERPTNETRSATAVTDDPPSAEYFVTGMLTAAEQYRVADYDRLAIEARERLPTEVLVRDVFSVVLHEAGDRWEKGGFSVVQEHMLTSAVRRQLNALLDAHNRVATGPALAFTTLSGERHELGSLMFAVLAASRGVRALWLGPDLPVGEVGRFCARVKVGAVAISLVTSPEVIDAVGQLRELRAVLPASIPLWLGGQAARRIVATDLPAGCSVVDDLGEFERRLVGLNKEGDPQ